MKSSTVSLLVFGLGALAYLAVIVLLCCDWNWTEVLGLLGIK